MIYRHAQTRVDEDGVLYNDSHVGSATVEKLWSRGHTTHGCRKALHLYSDEGYIAAPPEEFEA